MKSYFIGVKVKILRVKGHSKRPWIQFQFKKFCFLGKGNICSGNERSRLMLGTFDLVDWV
jgi:hypothetical protein